MRSVKDMYQDKIFSTEKFGDILVTEYKNGNNITVKFLNSGFETKVTLSQIKRGKLVDPSVKIRTIHGVGIIDVDYPVVKDQNILGNKKKWFCPYYNKWRGIITRCYSTYYKKKSPTYEECTVDPQWLYLSNFIKWVDSQPNKDWQNCELDKDILFVGNKHYSPSTTVFVDHSINSFILNCGASRGSLMLGVTKNVNSKTNPYRAQVQNPFTKKRVALGCFPTEIQAHLAWKNKKLEYAKQLAVNIDDLIVKNALVNYFSEDSDLTDI